MLAIWGECDEFDRAVAVRDPLLGSGSVSRVPENDSGIIGRSRHPLAIRRRGEIPHFSIVASPAAN